MVLQCLVNSTNAKPMWLEITKIVLGTVFIAVVYGITHDMVTAHTEISYFTMFHPHIINSASPVDQALAWGVIATWWMGLMIGVAIALCSQLGPNPRISAGQALKSLTKATVFVFIVAMATLAIGLRFFEGKTVEFQPDPSDTSGRFLAVLTTHQVSYFLSAIMAVGLCLVVLRKRSKLVANPPTSNPETIPPQ